MLKQEDIEIIERFVNGLADEKEKARVESLFINGENDTFLRQLLEKDWEFHDQNSSSSKINLSHLLERVHNVISKNKTPEKRTFLQRFIYVYTKAAAILLLPLIIAGGLAINFRKNHSDNSTDRSAAYTIYAPMGARVSFNLPDGTNGMLNSGSRLSYTLPFNNNRQISLEGEGWFEVKRDEKHPFKINMGNSTLKVLGTKFNVSAYPAEKYVEVVLKQGKVEFIDNVNHRKDTLSPAERLVFKDGMVIKSAADPEKYNGWTRGKLIFRGDPMPEVVRRIERWYNVKVELADRELEKYSYRATFEDDAIEDVFRYLSMTSPIRYKITAREMTVDGTYKKQIVTLYMKK